MIFVYVWDKGLDSFFCMWVSSFLNTIYWRNCLFSTVCSWYLCQTLIGSKCIYLFLGVYLFLGLCFAPFVYMSAFMPLLCWFDYYSFVVYFEISRELSSGAIFLLMIVFIFGIFCGYIWILDFFYGKYWYIFIFYFLNFILFLNFTILY